MGLHRQHAVDPRLEVVVRRLLVESLGVDGVDDVAHVDEREGRRRGLLDAAVGIAQQPPQAFAQLERRQRREREGVSIGALEPAAGQGDAARLAGADGAAARLVAQRGGRPHGQLDGRGRRLAAELRGDGQRHRPGHLGGLDAEEGGLLAVLGHADASRRVLGDGEAAAGLGCERDAAAAARVVEDGERHEELVARRHEPREAGPREQRLLDDGGPVGRPELRGACRDGHEAKLAGELGHLEHDLGAPLGVGLDARAPQGHLPHPLDAHGVELTRIVPRALVARHRGISADLLADLGHEQREDVARPHVERALGVEVAPRIRRLIPRQAADALVDRGERDLGRAADALRVVDPQGDPHRAARPHLLGGLDLDPQAALLRVQRDRHGAIRAMRRRLAAEPDLAHHRRRAVDVRPESLVDLETPLRRVG